MSLYSKKDAELAARILQPAYLPGEFLGYINDYNAVNQVPVPNSNIIGNELYNLQLDAIGTQKTVASNAAESTIFSKSIGAGLLGTNGAVRLVMHCDLLANDNGATRTVQLKVKYGATTMYDDTTAAFGNDTDRVVIVMLFDLCAANSVFSQRLGGFVLMSSVATTPVAGTGPLDTTGSLFPLAGTASENSELNKDFVVTIQLGSSSANLSFRRNYAVLTKIAHLKGGGDVAFAARSNADA